MEYIWKYLYQKEQLGAKSSEHPVLLTEAPNNPIQNREKAAEIMFEHLSVPALHVSIQAVLSLYASGRTTGCVLDSGDGVTHAVPVYEGFALNNSIRRVDIAGRNVTEYLKLLLRREGHRFTTSAEFETVRQIKERSCFLVPDVNVAMNAATKAHMSQQSAASNAAAAAAVAASSDSKKGAAAALKASVGKDALKKEKGSGDGVQNGTINLYDPREPRQYVLPDGKHISINTCRFRAPEILFQPHLIGEEVDGIHQTLLTAIQKSDLDLRSDLYSNIVLSGGTTLFEGFGDRLLREVKDQVQGQDVKIRISAPQERIFSTWIGGSILASLDTFRRMWITKADYENEGAKRMYLKNMM